MKREKIAVGAAVIGLLVLGLASPAQAHNYLVKSDPTAGQILTALPKEFSVTTNDLLLNLDKNNGFALQVTDAAGRYYGDGCVTVAQDTVSTDASLGAAGPYTMTWQLVSTDGHQVSNTIAFTWKPPAGFAAAPGASTVPDCNGTLKTNAKGDGVATSTKSVVDTGVLSTVLWAGGGILVIGIAVITTIVIAGRRKK
jgi:methionine-rich copper-binding protein CopC